MGVTVKVRLGFEDIFPEEKAQEVDFYLKGISREMLDKIPAHLASFSNIISNWRDWENLIFRSWFCKENEQFARVVYSRIIDAERKINSNPNTSSLGFLDEITSLIFLEYVLRVKDAPNSNMVDSTIAEQNLFKAIMVINSKENLHDNKINDGSGYSGVLAMPEGMFFTFGMAQYEILNTKSTTSFIYLFTCQLIKAMYCFDFLEKNYLELMELFFSKYSCIDFKDYVSKFAPIAVQAIPTEKDASLPKLIEINLGDTQTMKFLDNFIISPDSIDEDVDFRELRSAPLMKYSNNVYAIINNLFVIQKIYNGLYFELKDIYNLDGKHKKQNFRQLYTTEFTEKYLLYKVIEDTYKDRKYKRMAGDDLNRIKTGGSDYYMRNGNKIFLFENKDIFINAEIKTSFDIEKITNTIDEKLVTRKEGIPQLINNIRFVMDKQFRFDTEYKRSNVFIYPIIVTHRSEFDVPGVNRYLSDKFRKALIDLKKEGYPIGKIKDLTLINIDILLVFQKAFKDKKFNLDEAIESYHIYQSTSNNKPSSMDDLEEKVQRGILSFSDYIINVYCEKKNVYVKDCMQVWYKQYFEPTLFS